MINCTIEIVDKHFRFSRFPKPIAHCCYYANIEYDIDSITVKINKAAKDAAEGKLLWAVAQLFHHFSPILRIFDVPAPGNWGDSQRPLNL